MLLAVTLFPAVVVATSDGIIPPAEGCTTLQPIRGPPQDNTRTIYASTTFVTREVDCRGCSLVTRTFPYPATSPINPTTTTTITTRPLSSPIFECLPPSPTPDMISTGIPAAAANASAPTATPIPSRDPLALALLDALRTLLLAAELVAADGHPYSICSGLNPVVLTNTTNLNGTAIQNAVCEAGTIQIYNPTLYKAVVVANGQGLRYVNAAIFAVNVVAGGGGLGSGVVTKENRRILCGQIDAAVLNQGLEMIRPGGGDEIKRFVCEGTGTGNGTVMTPTATVGPY